MTLFIVTPLMTGCNDDIFTDSKDLPLSTEVTLDGDGGQWESAFSRHGLNRIYIDYTFDEKQYVRYFDVNGNLTDEYCPASELDDIVFENPMRHYSIGFLGDMIYVTSFYNADIEYSVTLHLEYDYGVTKDINFSFTAGEPLQIGMVHYKGELQLEENFEKITHNLSLTNNSQITQYMEVMPYLESRCSDIVKMHQDWANGFLVAMPILIYTGAEWGLEWNTDITLGLPRTFYPTRYGTEKIVVDVPANTKATITYTLYYTKAMESGEITFFNQISEQEVYADFTCEAIYATHYEYTVKYE